MGWSERGAWFERLLELRAADPGADDRIGVLSVADAIRYGEAVMAALDIDVEPWPAELDEPATATATDLTPRHGPRLNRQRRFASDLWPWPGPSTIRPTEDGPDEGRPG